jgi:hypothetical protein
MPRTSRTWPAGHPCGRVPPTPRSVSQTWKDM